MGSSTQGKRRHRSRSRQGFCWTVIAAATMLIECPPVALASESALTCQELSTQLSLMDESFNSKETSEEEEEERCDVEEKLSLTLSLLNSLDVFIDDNDTMFSIITTPPNEDANISVATPNTVHATSVSSSSIYNGRRSMGHYQALKRRRPPYPLIRWSSMPSFPPCLCPRRKKVMGSRLWKHVTRTRVTHQARGLHRRWRTIRRTAQRQTVWKWTVL